MESTFHKPALLKNKNPAGQASHIGPPVWVLPATFLIPLRAKVPGKTREDDAIARTSVPRVSDWWGTGVLVAAQFRPGQYIHLGGGLVGERPTPHPHQVLNKYTNHLFPKETDNTSSKVQFQRGYEQIAFFFFFCFPLIMNMHPSKKKNPGSVKHNWLHFPRKSEETWIPNSRLDSRFQINWYGSGTSWIHRSSAPWCCWTFSGLKACPESIPAPQLAIAFLSLWEAVLQ